MSLPTLPAFSHVFEATHGYQPYPWQAKLAARVVSDGRWPDTIGVPTGTGKTATLDVALYALAAEADTPTRLRRAPRRIVMVVDRRTIVDQSFRRAQVIREALTTAKAGPLVAMRQRLEALMGRRATEEQPLQIALLRGGVPRDDGWVRRPDQALLAVSTVDQVGSRLLFRGYGVRGTMQSVHAGLLGNDTLFLLDEVHLARPFQGTLEAIGSRWRKWRDQELPDRWQVVSLSATSGDPDAFELTESDRELDRLARRLNASKPVSSVVTASKTHDVQGRPHKRWVKALGEQVRSRVQDGRLCVGVVVNRVDTARAVAEHLSSFGDSTEVQLVTGRMRAADRVQASLRLIDRAGPGWPSRRQETDRPFVCVATQCIEAGADLDFDALVTEVASADALVQRFGRANRTGDHEQAPICVVAPRGIEALDDIVYGTAAAEAWAWLQERDEGFDASPAALEALDIPSGALAPQTEAAVLVPPHLDLLAMTAPTPYPDPDPAMYLHGLEPPRPEVQIVWRADIELDAAEQASRRLAAAPPTSFESLALPLAAAKQWLAGQAVATFADVGGDSDDARNVDRRYRTRVALGWDGDEATPVEPAEIRPGQTLIVPCELGGLSQGTFAPPSRGESTTRVEDVGDIGRTVRTGRPVLRLDARVHPQLAPGELAPPSVPDGLQRSLRDARSELDEWLQNVQPTEGSQLAILVDLLRRTDFFAFVDGATWILTGTRDLPTHEVLLLARGEYEGAPADDALTADDGSIVSSSAVLLERHLRGVAVWARDLADACGLPPALVDDLERAGHWHDLGKAHPRFQVLLHDGDEIRAASSPLLAKSGQGLVSKEARKRARQRSRLPKGFRHEMASVALLTGTDEGLALLDEAHDPDLVLHLVASHHGHARPFAPIEDHTRSGAPPAVEISFEGRVLTASGDHGMDRADSGIADRFSRVQRRYGWWGLAWLEAILRLADHRESEEEEHSTEEQA